MKFVKVALLILAFYFCALYVVNHKVFPYSFIKYYKDKVVDYYISNRVLNFHFYEEVSSNIDEEAIDKAMVFVTYGQSNSTNSGQIGYTIKNDVFMVSDGRIFLYQDPTLGGTGYGGSVWGRVGDLIIANTGIESVYFTNTGWGGKTVEELTHGHQFEYFTVELQKTLENFGRIDGILFHQGEFNNANIYGHNTYYETFVVFVEKVRTITDAPIYLSQASYCAGPIDHKLLAIQDSLIKDIDNVFRGPNTDLLIEPKYRISDNCHFSTEGYAAYAELWFNSIINPQER